MGIGISKGGHLSWEDGEDRDKQRHHPNPVTSRLFQWKKKPVNLQPEYLDSNSICVSYLLPAWFWASHFSVLGLSYLPCKN